MSIELVTRIWISRSIQYSEQGIEIHTITSLETQKCDENFKSALPLV